MRGLSERDKVLLRRQDGAALITSLMLLLVLTLLGLAGMQSSLLEERMAGNMGNRNMAFQAAEAALRDAEYYLENATLPSFNGTNGLYQPAAVGNTPRWEAVNWDDTDSRDISGSNTITGVAQQPRYIVEDLGALPSNDQSLVAGQAMSDVRAYRVTARGVGGSGLAQVVLQTTFKR
jgi:type IV pilus assembly protein PilX